MSQPSASPSDVVTGQRPRPVQVEMSAVQHARTINDLIAPPAAAADAYLEAFVGSLGMPPNLKAAVQYALLGGGKRLRPVLAWYSAAAVGAPAESSLPAGAAVELVHAFSLVHDDLPAMDDDDLRRGRPTLHRAFDEAMAILAGDAMLNYAFQILVEKVHDPVLVGHLCRELAIGTGGMIAGQVYDTLGGMPSELSDEHKLRLIHNNKTGALIRASCRMGAMLGLAPAGHGHGHGHGHEPGGHSHGAAVPVRADKLAAVSAYADAIGLMFQIVDDILDVTQTTEQLGKKSGKDVDAGKMTYPGVLGLAAANRRVDDLLAEALGALEPLGPAAEPLRELARYMAVRTK